MKKNLIIIILICAFLVSTILPFTQKAFADPGLIAQFSALSYSVAQSAGLNFVWGASNAGYSEQWMSNAITEYSSASGKSLVEIFGSDELRVVAGKLAVSQQAFNGAVEFLNWLVNSYDINVNDLTNLGYESHINPVPNSMAEYAYGTSGVLDVRQDNLGNNYWYAYVVHVDGTEASAGAGYRYLSTYPSADVRISRVTPSGVSYQFVFTKQDGTESTVSKTATRYTGNYSIGAQLSSDYVQPTVINPTQEWVGDYGAAPDTNLDQLVSDIFQDVADNNLVLEGEVIDIPIPPPTPEPIDPDTPLSDVPWEGLDNNLQQLYEQGLEEIGAIGDAQDAITDAVADQTGALEDALADNAGVVSGAIGQAVSDIQDSISEQTETLSESATSTAAATEAIAEALEDETINWQKFDLRGLFPFCIPFDIYNMLEALDASPTAPHVQLPFVIDSINFSYTIDLDFSAFDQVAAVMRQMELIAYAIALAWATSKVIKW